jgi:hypothetical protein
MRASARVLAPWLLSAWLGSGPAPVWAQTSRPAVRYAQPQPVCRITDPRLDEASGLVASRRNPETYYTHNDSGGQPEVYVLDREGHVALTLRLVGAVNHDWEDIALAPGAGPGTFDVCVADIGDNKARRSEIVFYRFPEPQMDAMVRARGVLEIRPQVFRCNYEDGARNAEAFAVDPRTGDGYVFTKGFDGASQVYRLAAPWSATAVTTLKCIGTLRFPRAAALARMVTAADISPDGTRLVTRSYVGGWEWCLPKRDDAASFTLVFEQTPAALKLANEPQGEALCFSADGRALLTISEQTPTTLYEVRQVENGGGAEP